MKIFGLAGWSGSGKTTLMKKLLPEFINRGLRVSTLKHAHHDVDIDQPGKDSYEHRRAGAHEVMLASKARWFLIHELRGEPEPDMEDLIKNMAPVDLFLVEGFKSQRHDKLEVYRASLGQELMCLHDDTIVAVASDDELPNVSIPVLKLNAVTEISNFIIGNCNLSAKEPTGGQHD